MNKKTLDIIMPAYNAHEKIVKALSSIAIQNVNFPFKVIVVNDGSNTDYSKEIDLFNNILKIEVVNIKNNSGVGVARQKGLEASKADYITFLDTDDMFFNCDSLQTLYNLLDDGKYDYAYGSILIEWDGKKDIVKEHSGCLHGKIINKKIIDKYNIKFNSTRTSEDNSFNHICMFNSKKINTSNDIVYIYNDSKKSLTKGLSMKKTIDNLIDYTDNVIYTLDNTNDIYDKKVLEFYLSSYLYVWNNISVNKDKITNLKEVVEKTLIKYEKYNELYTMEYIEKLFPGIGFSLFRKFIIEESKKIIKN